MKICGILQTNKSERDHLGEALIAMRLLCDHVVVLAHNSPASQFRRGCTILRLEDEQWNCTGNHALLHTEAKALGCDWVMRLDDDMDIPPTTVKKIRDMVLQAEAVGADYVRVTMRELWGGHNVYRSDGIWGNKTWALLHRNWTTMDIPDQRLHVGAIGEPYDSRDITVFHSGCMTRELREARVAKYQREDPDNRFQPDYSYMLDESGLELKPVDWSPVTT